MKRAATARSRVRWMIRRLRPDRNPLRRRADRIEAAVTAGLLAGLLAGAPMAALAAGGWQNAASLRTVRAQAAWHTVPAVLLRPAPRGVHALAQVTTDYLVPARWTAPDGAQRDGDVYAPLGAGAGTTVRVWTDGAGRLVAAPLRKADVVARVALAAALAVVAAVVTVLAVWLLLRRVLDRRRLAAWDTSWAETGPQWTGSR